ncbi:MAG TPA: DUF2341 domain-containing protein [Verrucomicrobiae bacterium]|nr:DUF2341 domain-containing protein [Verrucomicrobiae bacterium]
MGFGAFIVWLLLLAASNPAYASPLSDPAVDAYNMRVGTETFAGDFQFTTNTLLVETAEAITNLGSDVIKFYCGPNTSGQSGVTLTSNIKSLLNMVRDEPSYRKVFDMPFRHIIVWAYPLANPEPPFTDGNYSPSEQTVDYREMYDLTRYLLTNYDNSSKEFFLGHWEGDGYLKVNNWTTNPSPAVVTAMIAWLNNRQKAVDDARAATPHTNVEVYNYTEVNRVRDAMFNGSNNNVRVVNAVLPFVTNIDYVSYSSYDAQNLSAANLYATLDYIHSHISTNKTGVVPEPRMWIGEYGWGSQSTVAQEPLNRAYMQRLLNWNSTGHALQFILYWEMYSNFNPGGGTNYSLVDYTDTKTLSWYLHNYFYNDARLLAAQFKETNGRLPTDPEFVSRVTPLLNQRLSAPVSLSLTNLGVTFTASNAVTASGIVAQGIYGDDEASVWVLWGRQDGDTTFGSWENSRFIAVNSHFNPSVFAAALTNLAPDTNYYFRFFAINSHGSTWAPSSSQFTTALLNPADFGSRLKISFPGYNRGETLFNFPMLVNLSTNLPGFSYAQFASPAGGDLRFTDSSGLAPIPHEIDEWNTNGTSIVWVNVPSLSSPNDFIWAYWGNPAATNPPAFTTNGTVWPNHDLVWHLKETTLPFVDSAGQHPALTGTAPISTPGSIGRGSLFNGTSQFLNSGPVNVGTAFTLSAWVKVDPSASSIQTIWANKQGGWNSAGFALYVNSYQTSDQRLILETGDGVDGINASTVPNVVTPGQWHRVTASVDETGGKARLYVDGTDCTQASNIDTAFPNQSGINLGRFTNSSLFFKGALDEVRIEAGQRSSNWVWAAWMNVVSNTSLASYASVAQAAPALSIGGSIDGGTVLIWPASGVGFALYTSTNLAPPISWTLATNQPALSNNQWQITLPQDGSASRYYRLQSQ